MRAHKWLATAVTLVLLIVTAYAAGCQPSSPPPPPSQKEAAAPKTEVKQEPTAKSSQKEAPKAEVQPPGKTEAKPTAKTLVKVGLLGIVNDAPAWIAQEKGYFAEESIEIETAAFQSAVQMVPVMATGQLDVGVGGISAGLFNAIKRDIPIKMVADFAHFEKNRSGSGFVVRKDLFESGAIKTPSDLKGRTVSVNQANGQVAQIILDRMLKQGGLTEADVKVVEIAFADVTAAISNKSIDVGFVVEPMRTIGIERGIFSMLAKTDDLYVGQQNAAVFYSPQFANNNSEVAKRFLLAWVKGIRDYDRAFYKNQGKEEVIKVLTEHTAVKDPALLAKIEHSGINPDAYLDVKGIESDQEWYIQRGYMKEKVDLSQVVDNQFADYVISKLGKYQR